VTAPVSFRYLSQEDVKACGGDDMAATLEIVERVLAHHARHEALLPTKNVMRWGGVESETQRGRFNSMPGYVGGDFDVAGIKWISSFPSNPAKRGLPRGIGLTVINDATSGVPLGILEGTLISAMRTGAVSGVAARHLARAGTTTAALIGGGVIAHATARALHAALPELEEIRVFDIDPERLAACVQSAQEATGVRCVAAASSADAAAGAGVVVSMTTSPTPIVDVGMLAPDALYCQVGGNECTSELIDSASRVLADDWVGVKHRGTQTIAQMHARGEFPDERLDGELGDVVIGTRPGRKPGDGVIVLTAIGMGIEDLAIARVLMQEAERQNIGRVLPLWEQPFAV
jgi:ornithine cyclodeaminase